MAESVMSQAGARAIAKPESEDAPSGFDRVTSFQVLYTAFIVFMALYVVSVDVSEAIFEASFENAVYEASRVTPTDGPIVPQIQERVTSIVESSPWTRIGGVRLAVTVMGADGRTPLYVTGGNVVPPPPPADIDAAMREALRVLPARVNVFVSVPHGSIFSTAILVAYAAVLLSGLFYYNRAIARREASRLAAAVAAREAAAARARSIEGELDAVRQRLDESEPAARAHAEEIEQLQNERRSLRRKLDGLAEREAELRSAAEREATHLDEERQALEELLEEALEDVTAKEGEISELQDRLKTAAKKEPSSSSRSREAERLSKRFRTLYKSLVIDDRAISDLVGLRDENMRLRAEEALKRLTDDSEAAAVRRKVGGLPPQLSIFELGFAGKGRIYYTRAESGSYRVLCVGAKNTQKPDLEYLSRLQL